MHVCVHVACSNSFSCIDTPAGMRSSTTVIPIFTVVYMCFEVMFFNAVRTRPRGEDTISCARRRVGRRSAYDTPRTSVHNRITQPRHHAYLLSMRQ